MTYSDGRLNLVDPVAHVEMFCSNNSPPTEEPTAQPVDPTLKPTEEPSQVPTYTGFWELKGLPYTVVSKFPYLDCSVVVTSSAPC